MSQQTPTRRDRKLAAAFVLAVVFLFAWHSLQPAPSSSDPASASMAVYVNYSDGTHRLISNTILPLSLTCNGCTGGATSFSFIASVAVTFSGDTITGGSCSGTVSFDSPGGVSVASQGVTGTGSASTSPMQCPMTSATVPFSDFSSLSSGTYTLTASLSSSGQVTFTHGGPDSGVPYSASAVSASVTFTISDGVVTGVSGSI